MDRLQTMRFLEIYSVVTDDMAGGASQLQPSVAVAWFSIHMFIPDVMHTMHLGTYQYAMGSILQYLIFHKMPDDPETNLHAIWKLVKQYYEVLADCWVSIAAQSFDCVCINQCFPTH